MLSRLLVPSSVGTVIFQRMEGLGFHRVSVAPAGKGRVVLKPRVNAQRSALILVQANWRLEIFSEKF